jgi:hypothetical protein
MSINRDNRVVITQRPRMRFQTSVDVVSYVGPPFASALRRHPRSYRMLGVSFPSLLTFVTSLLTKPYHTSHKMKDLKWF